MGIASIKTRAMQLLSTNWKAIKGIDVIEMPIPIKLGTFQQMYGEAVKEFILFQGFAADMLILCNEDQDWPSIKASYELADQHYKKTSEMLNHLQLWHTDLTGNRNYFDWTIQERKENERLKRLAQMASSDKHHLMCLYLMWLRENQSVV